MAKGKKTVIKSAKTGRFVTKKHAQRSPNTTYRQTVPTKGHKRKK